MSVTMLNMEHATTHRDI